jgi:hypothetical protein
MNLRPIINIDFFKDEVRTGVSNLRVMNKSFNDLYVNLLKVGELFVIGGFLRNIANDKKNFRDIDLITTISTEKLVELIQFINLEYKINRLGGIKIEAEHTSIDVWSISTNWSFNKNRIKLDFNKTYRGDILLKKIADGSFFNFDSLVMDLRNFNCSVSNYNSFVENKRLDILRKSGKYKYQNPTREGNILRAYFLYKKYNIELSEDTKAYILNELENIKSLNFKDGLESVLKKSQDYIGKYKGLISEDELKLFFESLKKNSGPLFNK